MMFVFFNACKEDIQSIEQSIQNQQACNGYSYLCEKNYNEIVFACTHNAYNYATEKANFLLPNQNQSIEQQLKDGIRALMLDIYYADENIESDSTSLWLYHSLSIAGFASLKDELQVIHNFLIDEPNEVITLILESYVQFEHIEQAIFETGLSDFLYNPSAEKPWITLQEMIDRNERLVILTDQKEMNAESWYIYVWDYAFETHFSNKARSDFSCNVNRGNAVNDLFIFNHFITHPIIGTGLVDSAKVINQYDYLLNRILACESEVGKIPNFIAIDFYSEGNLLEVVKALNQP